MATPVRVALRCRPFIQREVDEGCLQTFGKLDTTSHTVQLRSGGAAYTFDWVFDQRTPQVDVYNSCINDGLDHLLEGYNFTVLAYGQTGSGKTFTMGSDHKPAQIASSDEDGIIPRAMQELFHRIAARKHSQKIEVRVSFIELYEGKVLDLLKGKKELQIRECNTEVYAHGAERAAVSSAAEVLAQLAVGSRNRATGGTAMNASSSRSHAIFTVYLKIVDANDEHEVKRAKCNLVDLAGSEKLAKTKATGDRQREGININVGLFCLGQVIDELTSNRQHVSYRNNNLTRLLQDSLGGNAHTVFIACVSPADSNFEETVMNVDPLTAELIRLKQENAELRLRCGPNGALEAQPGLEDVQKLLRDQASQISQLEQENDALRCSKEALTKDLADQAAKNCYVYQQLLNVEAERDQLREHMNNSGAEIEQALSSAFDVPLAIQDQMISVGRKLQAASVKPEVVIDAADSQSDLIDATADDVFGVQQQEGGEQNFQADYVRNQRALADRMDQLAEDIRMKEQEARRASKTDEERELLSLKSQRKESELRDEVARLEKEKEELLQQVAANKQVANIQKISEQRRLRLNELEAELKQKRKEQLDVQKLAKFKKIDGQKIEKLQKDIQAMKVERVKLAKQMKEEADKFRQYRVQKDKEVATLKQKDQRKDYELSKTKRDYEQQMNVLRRKQQEAQAVIKRLQQKQPLPPQFSDSVENKRMQKDIKDWLMREVQCVVDVQESRLHKDELIKQRTFLTKRTRTLKGKINRLGKAAGDGNDLELAQLQDELQRITAEIDQINAEIAILEQQIIASDASQLHDENKRFAASSNLAQAQCSLKQLFALATDAQLEYNRAARELADLQAAQVHRNTELELLKDSLAKTNGEKMALEAKYKQEMGVAEARFQEQICFLMRQLYALDVGGKLDMDSLRKIFKMDDLLKFEAMAEKLQDSETQRMVVAKELSKEKGKHGPSGSGAVARGKRQKLFPDRPVANQLHSSAHASNKSEENFLVTEDFTADSSSGSHKRKSSRQPKPVQRFGSLVNILSPSTELLDESANASFADADDGTDPDYRDTPLAKKLRTLIKCKCDISCSKDCICVQQKEKCNDKCYYCDRNKCPNFEGGRNLESSTSDNSSFGLINLNDTFTLPEKPNNDAANNNLNLPSEQPAAAASSSSSGRTTSFFPKPASLLRGSQPPAVAVALPDRESKPVKKKFFPDRK